MCTGTLKTTQTQATEASVADRSSTANSSIRSESSHKSSSSINSDSVLGGGHQRTGSGTSSSPPETIRSGVTETDRRLSVVRSVTDDDMPSRERLSSAASTLMVFNPELPPAAAEAAVEKAFAKNARVPRRMVDLKLGRLQKRTSQSNLMHMAAAGSMPDLMSLALSDLSLTGSIDYAGSSSATGARPPAMHRQSAFITPAELVKARYKAAIATTGPQRALAYSTMDLTQLSLPDSPASAATQSSRELVNAPLPSSASASASASTSAQCSKASEVEVSSNHTAGDKDSAPSSGSDSPLRSSSAVTGSLTSEQRSGSATALAAAAGGGVSSSAAAAGALQRCSNSPTPTDSNSTQSAETTRGGVQLRKGSVFTSSNSTADLRMRSDSYSIRSSTSLSSPVQQNIIRCAPSYSRRTRVFVECVVSSSHFRVIRSLELSSSEITGAIHYFIRLAFYT